MTFSASLDGLSAHDYLTSVERAILAGNIPASFANYVPVPVTANGMFGTFFASPLPLCVGDEPFHAPISASVAQRIADARGEFLPTRKMVDAIHAHGTHVPFHSYGADREAVSTYIASSNLINARIAGRTGLICDFAKDYVLSNQRKGKENLIAIYGAWSGTTGDAVQNLTTPHSLGYFDYSQHARMISAKVLVNGVEMALVDALADRRMAALFSDEGTITGAMLMY